MGRMRTLSCAILTIALGPAVAFAGPAPTHTAAQEPELACIIMTGDRMPPATRRSPLDSVTFKIQDKTVKVCYGRPSARGRSIMGGLVPYGSLWRTGANEPTMLHTAVALEVAGISIEPGSYSLYTVPGESQWEIVVNRSISQWGHESRYTADVQAQEVGRAIVAAGASEEHVEMFTMRAEPGEGDTAMLVMEWERTRVKVPISAVR